ncbi:hypothetical protein BIZ83_gp202 [Erwinia phage vB_EamM_ChrisDB]|uniref:hypothetical protein n=1 Tax=Erwinia phage vB_EamM_ChrisDB TaxID=1883371 RepID=UPI00081D1DB4|nr:hypothetical protein BIZ83_gp202 [Erwinia phage vB_EamM_ChrisDB]ANZ48651.1 hypothetical protein CHRISDB_89 [Erwinia phage vB_EamM_ChrisDB]
MEYVLTKSKLTASLFDGRGYLVTVRDNKERRGIMNSLFNSAEMYMSRDAVEVIRRWVRMWELKLENDDEFKCLGEVLHFGDIEFVMFDRSDYGWPMNLRELKETQPEAITEIFNTIRENFTTGYDEATWHKQNDYHVPYLSESYNVPGRMMQFNFENDSVAYDYRLFNQPVPIPYVSRDMTMIRMAESLINIANTKTYPYKGYKLDLQLGFGNMELAELNRDQLLEIAQRLIP